MSDKIPVIVFMPIGVCACSQVDFLGRIYQAVRKFQDVVDYREYTAASEVAKRYGIDYRGVVVGSKNIGNNPTSAMIEKSILEEIEKQGITIS
ncbi:MAG: hypothetical protein ACTSYL_04215 [Candidatus Thorarchaeota archaeon]